MAPCHSSHGKPPLPPQRPARLLVVDDEPMIRDLLKRFLESLGHQVTVAVDGKEALDIFRADSFDLILSDVKMPGLSGLQLLRAVRELTPRVPVILVSGYGEIETVVAALKDGAENFLTKPLQMDLLGKVVNQSLALRRLEPGEGGAWRQIRQSTFIEAPSQAELVRELVYQVAQSAVAVGFARRDLDNNLKLALTEGITNAMEHGNRWDPEQTVSLQIEASRERLEVTIGDRGPGFDFRELPDPTEEGNLLCERGRGIFLMRAILDEVRYFPPGNRVLLRKHKSGPGRRRPDPLAHTQAPKFCPECGGRLAPPPRRGNGGPPLACLACGLPVYLDPKLAVACVVETAGGVLLLRRAQADEAHGRWILPGGHVDRGERSEARPRRCARRPLCGVTRWWGLSSPATRWCFWSIGAPDRRPADRGRRIPGVRAFRRACPGTSWLSLHPPGARGLPAGRFAPLSLLPLRSPLRPRRTP